MTPFLRSWLTFIHKWIGYPTGIFLFILFFTGALATSGTELQQWMEPQTYIHAPLTDKGINRATSLFAQSLQHDSNSFLRLPTQRDPVIRILHFNGHIFSGIALNPETGEVIKTENHSGATFFVLLHSSFHLPKFYGALIGCFIFSGLILVLITGLWIHLKRFFPDLLLFRPQSSENRRWLDLHLLLGCVILPVMMIISFSGTILNLHRLGLISSHHNHHQAPSRHYTELPSLLPMVREGMKEWHDIEGSFFLNTPDGLHFIRGDETHFCGSRSFITQEGKASPALDKCKTIILFHAIHNVRWVHGGLRYYISLTGLLGALLTASGLILFYRQAAKQIGKKPGNLPLCHLYKTLNDGTLMGLPLATLCLLALTRLPTPSFMATYQWEMLAFFSLWGGSYFISLITNGRYAVLPCLLVLAGFGLFPLDLMTRSFEDATKLCFAIDLCAALIGLAALIAFRKMRKNT